MKRYPKRSGRKYTQIVAAVCCLAIVLLCVGSMAQEQKTTTPDTTPVTVEDQVEGRLSKDPQRDASRIEEEAIGATARTGATTETTTHESADNAVEAVSDVIQGTDGDKARRVESQPAEKSKIFQMPEDAVYVPDVVLVSVGQDGEDTSPDVVFAGRDLASVVEDSLQWITVGVAQLEVAQGYTVEDAVNELETSGAVDGAQPDYIYGVEEERPSLYEAMAYVEQLPAIEQEIESTVAGSQAVDDPYYDMQWGLQSMNVPEAWQSGAVCEQKVGVAVIDSGFIVDHEDLQGVIPEGAPYNAYYASKGITDPDKLADVSPTIVEGDPNKASPDHGMHVAGIVAAQAHNGKGIAGVSYNAQLVPIRSYNYGDSHGNYGATSSSLQKALDYVVEKQDAYNIRVVNMSIGSKTNALRANDLVLKKIDEVYAKGIVVVCSGGNETVSDKPPFINYPSDYVTAVSVLNLKNLKLVTNYATIDRKSYLSELFSNDYHAVSLADKSNFNYEGDMAKDICAPGSQILSTTMRDDNIRQSTVPYSLMGGTSMASPHVAGVLALMFSQKADVPKTAAGAQYMVDALYSSARQLTDKDFDWRYGYGEADALGAINAVNGPYIEGPTYVHTGQDGISFGASSGSGWQFSTTDESILSVSPDGATCSALRTGQVAVVATQGDQKLRKTVTVVGDMMGQGVIAVETSKTFSVDQPTMLMWDWASSDEDGATITDTGTLNAGKKAAKTTITATLKSSGGVESDLSLSEDVYVVGPLTGPSVIPVGKTAQFSVVLPNESGLSLEDFDWTVGDDSIVTVDKRGLVTGKAAGLTIVSASYPHGVSSDMAVQFDVAVQVTNDIPMAEVTIASIENQSYTGVAITPKPEVTWNDVKLIEGTDYRYVYKDNVNPGTASVEVVGMGSFSGSKTVQFTIEGSEIRFVDVSQSTPHAGDIMWLAQTGISRGWRNEDGTLSFRPESKVVRADMAAFLYRLAELRGAVDKDWTPKQTNAFKDVSSATPHAKEILWLAENGISTGWTMPDGTKEFRPFETVKRQDMAAFMFRLAKLAKVGGASDTWAPSEESKTKFCDVDGNDPHNHHVEVWWLAETGVSRGWDMGDGTFEFRGLGTVIRQDMAAFLRRLDGLR